MHYKKTIALFVTLAIPLLFVNFAYMKSSGAHPGATGAPGDGSCADAGCHTGNVVPNDTKVNSLIFPTPDSTYVPGKIYLVKIKVSNTGIKRFGFEVGALFEATDKNAGMMKVAEVKRTQLLSHKINNDTRYEITHTQNGNTPTTTGTIEWTFNWVAPATDQGNVVFYYATNSTNNDAQASGDNICLSKFTLKPASSSGIDQFINASDVFTFYNQNEHALDLKYTLKKENFVKISVVDALGQEVYISLPEQKAQGTITEKITLPSIAAGIYYVNIQCGNSTQLTKKVLVN